MATQNLKGNVWLIDRWTGGLSEGSKRGVEGSFRAGQGLDFRDDPDSLTGLKKLTKNSGTTVTDAVKWIVTAGTDTWFYGNTGKVYKRTSAGTWSNPKTISDSHGNGMAVFDDYIYFASDNDLHRYGPLSGTPAWQDNFLTSIDQVDQYAVESGQTYTVPVAITEDATNQQDWTSGVTSIDGIVVDIAAKGTGDWTIYVHNDADDELGIVTIANADLPASGLYKFIFSNGVSLSSGTAYHFHLVSTVADGTVVTGTNADLNDCSFSIHADIGVEDVDQSTTVALDTTTAPSTYTIPSTVSELDTGKIEFIPDKNNITGIGLQMGDGQSGTYTVTIHDDTDTTVGSVTKTTFDAKAYGFMRFDLSSPVSVVPGATYHIHVTVSAGTHTILTSTASSLADAGFKVYYQILDDDEDFHPMMFFPPASALVIGNGNFLAVYDGIVYRTSGQGDGSERLKLAKEEKIRALDVVGDYLAMGTWKGDTIDDHGNSNLYFWDGTSTFINAFKSIIGETNAIKTGDDGLLHILHGGDGLLSIYDGGLTKVETIPAIGENKYIEVYPGAITTHEGYVKFGISDGDSTTVKRGVYSYGRKTKNYPRALNFDNPISTGTTGSNAQITAVHGIGPDRFFVAWKDDTAYGVDLIDTTSDQATVSFETLIFDAGLPHFEKKSTSVKLTFEALTTGQSIKVYAKRDRASSFTQIDGDTITTVGQVLKSIAYDYRWKELELKVELITSGTNSPTLISLATFYDVIPDEQET